MSINERIQYGIGIVSDLTEIGLGTRVLEDNAVEITCSAGEIERVGNKTEIKIGAKRKDVVEIEIKSLDDSAQANIEIHVKSGADIVIHETTSIKDLLNLTLNMYLAPNAKVQYLIDQQAEHGKFIIAERYAHVSKDSTLEWIDIELGGKISKSELHTHLLDSGARGEIYGVFYGRDKQAFDLYNVVHHVGSNSTSIMDVRGVLDDNSKGIYRGLIHIPKGSYSCDGAQSEKTLMLSQDAQISSVPDLQIENNDVKCSHAVSTTHIDPTSLFYLQSRGLNIEEAQKIIVESHYSPVLDRITDESLRIRLREQLLNKLSS